MSYSRWTGSTWYTYWHCCNDMPGASKDDQILSVHYSLTEGEQYKYSDLNISDSNLENLLTIDFTDAQPKEIEELVVYVKSFLRDVASNDNYK